MSYYQQSIVGASFYELVSADPSPVSLADMKNYLKISTSADDALIQSMIDAATEWGEKYTGREFRSRTWDLLLDCFADRINLRRDPVASITSVDHLVSGSPVTVSSTVYYLKKLTQNSEILINDGEEWPTNTDDREQAITIRFVTEGYRCQDLIIESISRMVAFWYRNRGDCGGCSDAASGSGVKIMLDGIRISRV